jgi:redox-sensitive bicupin YhaK (pirin superfamily)
MENRMPLLFLQVRQGGLREGRKLPPHVHQGIEGLLGGIFWVVLGHFGGEIIDRNYFPHGCHDDCMGSRGIREFGTIQWMKLVEPEEKES